MELLTKIKLHVAVYKTHLQGIYLSGADSSTSFLHFFQGPGVTTGSFNSTPVAPADATPNNLYDVSSGLDNLTLNSGAISPKQASTTQLSYDAKDEAYLCAVASAGNRSYEISSPAHSNILSDRLTNHVLNPIDNLLNKCKEIEARIALRNKDNEEVAYYTKKVNELKNDRAERQKKGKEEKPKDIEQLDRNVKKLEEISSKFEKDNSQLVSEIDNMWDSRRIILAEPLLEFHKIQKQFASTYLRSLDNVPVLVD